MNSGDKVYLKDGRIGHYKAKLPEGHLVMMQVAIEYQHDNGDYEQYLDDSHLEIVNEVYEKAPTEEYDESIKKLREEESGLIKTISKLNKYMLDKAAEHEAFVKQFEHDDSLRNIAKLVSGKITHMLVWPRYQDDFMEIKVLPIDEALKIDDRYDKKLKMLSLFGRYGNIYEWQINQYSDGSGRSELTAIPFENEDDAIKKARGMITDMIREFPDTKNKSSASNYIKKSCGNIGVEIPKVVKDFIRESKLRNIQQKLDEATKKTQELNAQKQELSQ